jgi:DNA-directed RNA polymerase specialized sigma24 family protein
MEQQVVKDLPPEDKQPAVDERPARFPVEDEAFIEELWKQYYVRLKKAVASRVTAIRRPVANDSEIALSAFQSFVERARAGQFPDLADEDEMWRLLRTIAIRKANDLRKHLRAKKRGGDRTIFGQADLECDDQRYLGLDRIVASVDSPAWDVEVLELFNRLMAKLPDDRHRDAILLKLQGAPVVMISECLKTSTRTVQRLLKQIEQQWQEELL